VDNIKKTPSLFIESEKNVQAYVKQVKKEQRKAYAEKKYWECVEKYKAAVQIDNYYLDNPIGNYRLYDKGLYLRYNNSCNLLKDFGKGFNSELHSDGYKLEKRVIRRLYAYLKIFSPYTNNTFESIKDYYFFKYYPIESQFNFLTHFTYTYFVISDKNLCYINTSHYCFDIGLPKLLIVDNNVSKRIFAHFHMPVPTTSVQKKLFTLLKMELSFQVPKSKKLLALHDKIPLVDLNTYSGLINYSIKSHCPNTKKGNYYIDYDPDTKTCSLMPTIYPFTDYINYTSLAKAIDITYVPDKIAFFLYSFTAGDYDCLNNIACLVADILTHKNIHKKLNVIYSESALFPIIQKFIDIVSTNRCTHTNLAINKLAAKTSITKLISLKNDLKTTIIIDNYTGQITSNSYAIFKKMILGKEFSFDDNFMTKAYYINNMAFVRLTDDYHEVNNYRNNLDINLINLSSCQTPIPTGFSEEDLNWILLPLALHGISIINKKTSLPITPKKEIKSNPVAEFYDTFCVPSVTSKEVGNTLYEKYSQFFDRLYGGNTLTSICFIKELKKHLQTKQVEYTYGQVLHTSTSNARGFRGFEFDNQKFNDYLENHINPAFSHEFSDFKQYLLQMNNLIPTELTL
jgi:hypothetical protein